MATAESLYLAEARQHAGEEHSNEVRRRATEVEPRCLRTYTPSQAVLARSAGCYHWTPEGRKLIDFTSGVLVANLGHNPARWWQRVMNYMQLPQQMPTEPEGTVPAEFVPAVTLTSYNALTDLEVEASRRLLANMQAQPGGSRCEQVLWAASGSEAVQKALWTAMARRPGEQMLLATRRGFHGKKGLAGAVTGDEHYPERDPRVKFLSFPIDECIDTRRRGQPVDLAPYEAELHALWAEHGSAICGIITEPYLGGGGSFHPQPAYLQLLQNFCREHDLVFILDEVQSNFGRTGAMYAYTSYGLEPDIVVLGKGLGNGIAVSAAVGRADLFARMNYGEGSDTWSGNPLSSAAVLATLDEFETTPVLEHAEQLALVIRRGLERMQDELPHVAHVRGDGVVWGIECCGLGEHPAGEVANACVEACYLGDEQGRAIHLLGPLSGRVIRVSPPLVLPLAEAEEAMEVLYERFAAVGQSLTTA